jgi:predicted small metal-binding protein
MADLSDKRTEMPADGAVSNDLLMMASLWSVTFDLQSANLRCVRCGQSIMAIGAKGMGYMTNIQEVMGQIVMHMIQAHGYTREGIIGNGK